MADEVPSCSYHQVSTSNQACGDGPSTSSEAQSSKSPDRTLDNKRAKLQKQFGPKSARIRQAVQAMSSFEFCMRTNIKEIIENDLRKDSGKPNVCARMCSQKLEEYDKMRHDIASWATSNLKLLKIICFDKSCKRLSCSYNCDDEVALTNVEVINSQDGIQGIENRQRTEDGMQSNANQLTENYIPVDEMICTQLTFFKYLFH